MKPFLLCMLFVVAVGCCNAQKFKPVLNLTKDNTYFLSAGSTSAITQTISGQQNKVSITLNWKMSFKVTGLTDSIYSVDASYQALSTKIEQTAGYIDFDSGKNDPQDKPSMVFTAITNKPVKVEISKSGKVKSVSSADELILNAISSVSQLDTIQQAQVNALLKQYFDPETIKGYLETGVSIFPAGPVAKDDKWKVDVKRESPAKMTIGVNYQLTDVAQGLYFIHGEGTISGDKNTGAVQINGMPVKYNLNGSLISDVRLNRATGWVSSIKTTQLMVGDMQILDNPQVPGGVSIPVSFSTDVVMTGN